MKYLLFSLFLVSLSLTSYSQSTKTGTMYCYHKDTGAFLKIPAELVKI